MKKHLLFLILLFLTTSLLAQLEVKPGSFKEVPGFVNSNQDPNYQNDDNDLPFAVIKVKTENITDKQRRDLHFDSNLAVGIMLEYKTNEVWVYVTAKYADYLKISHPDLSSIDFVLPYALQPRKGYEMTLVNKTSIVSGSGTLTIITKPENGATIILNGSVLSQKTPYTNDLIATGQYDIIVTKEKYKPATKSIIINDGDNITVELEMPTDVAIITMDADDETDVYIDGSFMKRGTWSGELTSGQHNIVYKKQYYHDAKRTITVEVDQSATYSLNPEPIYGEMKLSTEPSEAKVFIDGNYYGTTPININNLIIGPHQVTFENTNCAPLTTTFLLEQGKQLIINEVLPVGKEYTIVSNTMDDKIFIDNNYVGNSPLKTVISYGQHIVSVERGNDNEKLIQRFMIMDKNDKHDTIRICLTKGVIVADFSISDGKKVYFSTGNLQYHAVNRAWRFAERQSDIIGESNKYITDIYQGWIDLFGGGTGRAPTKNTTSVYAYNEYFYDWGINTISNTEGKGWRTLTKEEWDYVFNKRNTNSGVRFVKAIVNGHNGVILLPDDWDSRFYALNSTNTNNAPYANNNISEYDWYTRFEGNGAVFLPAAGYRDGININQIGESGYYWSVTRGGENNVSYFSLSFDNYRLNTANDRRRYNGYSVRLVCNVE